MIPAVDTEMFWGVIAATRAHSGLGKPFDQALSDFLATWTERDILAYQQRFDELHAALYRWDMWSAAYLIGGGCSDDGFIDFRAGLIAQGHAWYEMAVASPDSLVGHPAVLANRSGVAPLFDEMASYAAQRAFERVAGHKDAFNEAWAGYRDPRERISQEPAGEDFDFDDAQQMRRRLPRLSAIFLLNEAV
jgi:Protein of unknown function (DUF4240)